MNKDDFLKSLDAPKQVYYSDLKFEKYVFVAYDLEKKSEIIEIKKKHAAYFVIEGHFKKGPFKNEHTKVHLPIKSFQNSWRNAKKETNSKKDIEIIFEKKKFGKSSIIFIEKIIAYNTNQKTL